MPGLLVELVVLLGGVELVLVGGLVLEPVELLLVLEMLFVVLVLAVVVLAVVVEVVPIASSSMVPWILVIGVLM